ncbi:transcriptional regulator [Ochrobactrum sp. C6C9]|uniref:helix-turn-helix domain-containing protein n=1 Tax=Ochrobactrum sp. C6C9 TaxID=2736662 RepID=UPI00353023D6|nr:transcriptional regulator [Ochrobactrum sp. C6C9]
MHKRSLESSSKEAIGLRLLEMRRKLGFTQGVMAAKLGISDRTYKYYEQGQRESPIGLLIQSAALASTDLLWLLTGEKQQTVDLETYDQAVVSVLEELSKREIYLEPDKIMKLSRQIYDNIILKNTSLQDEVKNLVDIFGVRK